MVHNRLDVLDVRAAALGDGSGAVRRLAGQLDADSCAVHVVIAPLRRVITGIVAAHQRPDRAWKARWRRSPMLAAEKESYRTPF